jgi:hypothetical protein
VDSARGLLFGTVAICAIFVLEAALGSITVDGVDLAYVDSLPKGLLVLVVGAVVKEAFGRCLTLKGPLDRRYLRPRRRPGRRLRCAARPDGIACDVAVRQFSTMCAP